jgi:hypothetical protein
MRNKPSEFIAWCAKTEDLGNGPLEVDFAHECHFEFGATADEALAKLKAQVFN